jgi:small subunit ribosomal protein S5
MEKITVAEPTNTEGASVAASGGAGGAAGGGGESRPGGGESRGGGGDSRGGRHQPNRSRRGRPEPEATFDIESGKELTEKVVFINRSAKVVKGGRRFNFSALIVVGDRHGRVGIGLGKAGEVADAIRKGGEVARSSMVRVSLKDATLPHEVFSHYGGAKVLLRPASPGTGVIAGKTVRAVLESVGVKDVLSKSMGSKNAANVVKATLQALLSMRLREDIYRGRGLEIKKVPTPRPPEAFPTPQPPGAPSAEAPTPV